MIYAAAAVYVLLFWLIGWSRPRIALLLIFAAAPFQHDISAGGPVRFSLAEINLMLAVPLFFARSRPLVFGPTFGPILLFMGISAAACAVTWRSTSLVSLVQMALYLIVAVLLFTSFVRTPGEYRLALNGLLVAGLVLAVAAIASRGGYVLGLHKNGVGSSLAATVVVAAELWFAAETGKQRRRLAMVMAVVSAGLFFTLSRGAWIGAACGLMILLLMRRQFTLLWRLGIALVPLIAICWQLLPEASQDYVTGFDTEKNLNIQARFDMIEFARFHFEQSPLLGVGVGLRKEYDATNLFWLTLAETGVLGLGALLLVHVALFRMVWKAQRYLPVNDPLFSLVALGGALVTSKFLHGMVDHYWSRGGIMIAWAAAGMATHAFIALRARLRAERALALEEEELETAPQTS